MSTKTLSSFAYILKHFKLKYNCQVSLLQDMYSRFSEKSKQHSWATPIKSIPIGDIEGVSAISLTVLVLSTFIDTQVRINNFRKLLQEIITEFCVLVFLFLSLTQIQ